ncbi:hypothetical protein GN244_ATG19049 [Phytophthora infestans]|uniref:Uncharacterized protein n=1 Tax=Phytophthora infestans TaxID=4787 RepID=A0A833SK61_PHYIN|nr:hypothetical protein GN244_ATG19049 [Phytophthora infestans]
MELEKAMKSRKAGRGVRLVITRHEIKKDYKRAQALWCGRILSGDGVRHDPASVEALTNLQPPTTGQELQQFVCAPNWMRTSLRAYNKLIDPPLKFMEKVYEKAGGRKKTQIRKYSWDRHEAGLIDLTASHEFDAESAESSRARPPGPPSLPDDAISGARGQSSSAAPDILKGNYAALDYSQIIGDLRADNQAVQEENRALTRRLDTLALSNVDLSTQLSSARQQVSRLEAATTQSANLLASLRKAVALSKAKLARAMEAEQGKVKAALSQAQLHHQQVLDRDAEIAVLLRSISERDAAFVTLQGIAFKHSERLQQSVQLYSSTGTQPLRHAQLVIAEQRAVILRQERLIPRNGVIPMHDPHMAAAAGAGLEVPGLDPSDLRLNARLCRVLDSRFPKVLHIPAGETRRLGLIVHPRQDASVTGSAAGPTVAPPAATATSQPEPTVAQLYHTPLADLTSTQRLRRYANPKSPTAAGPRHCSPPPHPPQPYACPHPEEEGHETISALLRSISSHATVSDGGKPRFGKSRRQTRRKKVRHLQLSSATQPAVSAHSEDDDEASSEAEYAFEMPEPSDADEASSEAEYEFEMPEPADDTVPAFDSTSSVGSPSSGPLSTSSVVATQPPPVSSSDVMALLPVPATSVCAPGSTSPISAELPQSSVPLSVVSTVVGHSRSSSGRSSHVSPSRGLSVFTTPTDLVTPAVSVLRPSLPACSAVLTSSSGHPIQRSAATARTVTAQLLEDLDASDDEVLGPSDGSAPSTGSTSLAAGSRSDPISLSENSASCPSGFDSAVEDARCSAKARSLHAAIIGSDDEMSDESLPPSDRNTSRHSSMDSGDGTAPSTSASASGKQQRRKRRASSVLPPASTPDLARAQYLSAAPSPSVLPVASVPSQLSSTASRPASVTLPSALTLPLTTLRTRASQAVSKDCRLTLHMAQLREVPFMHFGSARCWNALLDTLSGGVQLQLVGGDSRVPPTPCSLDDIRAFMAVFNPSDPCQRFRRMLPELPFFFSPSVLEEARRCLASQFRPRTLMQVLGDMWVKLRGDSPLDSAGKPIKTDGHMTRYFVALYERRHWIVESSVLMGLHPDVNPTVTPAQLAEVYELWMVYKRERKRRSDTLRSLFVAVYDQIYSAVTQKLGGEPAPLVDAEVYFDPSVPH